MNLREWPLVFFTVLGQAAAGAAVVLFLPLAFIRAGAAGPDLREFRLGAALLIFVLSSLAASFSFFHLSRPVRAPRALRNIGGSWLSRELVFQLLFIASAALLAAAEWKEIKTASVLGPLAAAAGLVFVFAMARIYTRAAVPEWRSWRTAASFFSTSFVLGAMIAAVYAGRGIPLLPFHGAEDFSAGFRVPALAILGLAFLVAFFQAPRFGRRSPRTTPLGFRPNRAWPKIFAVRMFFFAAAIIFWALAFLIPETAGPFGGIALLAAAVSEIIGRFLFFALPLGL